VTSNACDCQSKMENCSADLMFNLPQQQHGRREKGRGGRAQFVERPILKEETKSKMNRHPPIFRAHLQMPEFTHSSNDHRINAKTSLPFSSCFLDFKIACSYGLETDKLPRKCGRKACKKASSQSLSVP